MCLFPYKSYPPYVLILCVLLLSMRSKRNAPVFVFSVLKLQSRKVERACSVVVFCHPFILIEENITFVFVWTIPRSREEDFYRNNVISLHVYDFYNHTLAQDPCFPRSWNWNSSRFLICHHCLILNLSYLWLGVGKKNF